MKIKVRSQLFRAFDNNVRTRLLHLVVTGLHSGQAVHATTKHDDHEVSLGKRGGAGVEHRRSHKGEGTAGGDEFTSVHFHTFNIHSLGNR